MKIINIIIGLLFVILVSQGFESYSRNEVINEFNDNAQIFLFDKMSNLNEDDFTQSCLETKDILLNTSSTYYYYDFEIIDENYSYIYYTNEAYNISINNYEFRVIDLDCNNIALNTFYIYGNDHTLFDDLAKNEISYTTYKAEEDESHEINDFINFININNYLLVICFAIIVVLLIVRSCNATYINYKELKLRTINGINFLSLYKFMLEGCLKDYIFVFIGFVISAIFFGSNISLELLTFIVITLFIAIIILLICIINYFNLNTLSEKKVLKTLILITSTSLIIISSALIYIAPQLIGYTVVTSFTNENIDQTKNSERYKLTIDTQNINQDNLATFDKEINSLTSVYIDFEYYGISDDKLIVYVTSNLQNQIKDYTLPNDIECATVMHKDDRKYYEEVKTLTSDGCDVLFYDNDLILNLGNFSDDAFNPILFYTTDHSSISNYSIKAKDLEESRNLYKIALEKSNINSPYLVYDTHTMLAGYNQVKVDYRNIIASVVILLVTFILVLRCHLNFLLSYNKDYIRITNFFGFSNSNKYKNVYNNIFAINIIIAIFTPLISGNIIYSVLAIIIYLIEIFIIWFSIRKGRI